MYIDEMIIRLDIQHTVLSYDQTQCFLSCLKKKKIFKNEFVSDLSSTPVQTYRTICLFSWAHGQFSAADMTGINSSSSPDIHTNKYVLLLQFKWVTHTCTQCFIWSGFSNVWSTSFSLCDGCYLVVAFLTNFPCVTFALCCALKWTLREAAHDVGLHLAAWWIMLLLQAETEKQAISTGHGGGAQICRVSTNPQWRRNTAGKWTVYIILFHPSRFACVLTLTGSSIFTQTFTTHNRRYTDMSRISSLWKLMSIS